MKVSLLLALAFANEQQEGSFSYMEVSHLDEAETAANRRCGFCHEKRLSCDKDDADCLNGFSSQHGLHCPDGKCCNCVPNIMKSFCLQYDSPKSKVVTTHGPQVYNLFPYGTRSQDIVFNPSCSEAFCAHKKCKYSPRLIGMGIYHGNPRFHGFQILEYGQMLCDFLQHGSTFEGCGPAYSNLNQKSARAGRLMGIVAPQSPIIGCLQDHKITIYSNLYISSPTWNYLAITELFNEVLLLGEQQEALTRRVQQLEYAVEELIVISTFIWATFVVFALCVFGMSPSEFLQLISSKKVAAIALVITKALFKVEICDGRLAKVIALFEHLLRNENDCSGHYDGVVTTYADDHKRRALSSDVFA